MMAMRGSNENLYRLIKRKSERQCSIPGLSLLLPEIVRYWLHEIVSQPTKVFDTFNDKILLDKQEIRNKRYSFERTKKLND